MTAYYDPVIGKIVFDANPPPTPEGYDRIIMSQDVQPHTCLAIIDRVGIPINSAFNITIVHRTMPYVDGITLEGGLKGDAVPTAMRQGTKYHTHHHLPIGSDYYLGLDSKITLNPADLTMGAKWMVKVARWVNGHEFIFDPQAPLDLLHPSPAATISIGTTVTGAPGTPAMVSNSGTPLSVILDFVIPQGIQGPPGEPGDKHYLHHQIAPVDIWYVTHNLGKFPSVTCWDSAQNQVEGDVDWIDENHLSISFGTAFSGDAFLN
jgi:hypothetical protein